MDAWRSALVRADAAGLWIRGYEIASLMTRTTFAGTVFLLHRGRIPTPGEERLLNAILVAGSDLGSGAPSCAASRIVASGNRQSVSAAVAAGILAIGDEHDGAASRSMDAIEAIVAQAGADYLPMVDAARLYVERERDAGRQVPGLGHRELTKDQRVDALLDLASQEELAGDGIAAMRALETAAARLIEPLPLNIDGAMAAVLFDLGFPPAAGNLMFIVSRVAGLTAEVLEEYTRERPMRIRIPVEYDGVPPVDGGGSSP
jgi:citrate synthase